MFDEISIQSEVELNASERWDTEFLETKGRGGVLRLVFLIQMFQIKQKGRKFSKQ